MKIKSTLVICFFIVLACGSYEPFSSLEEKKETLQFIKSELKLSNTKYNSIKKEDSILYEINQSIEEKVKYSLINRRIDSFIAKSYNKGELKMMLQLDRVSDHGAAFEFDRDNSMKGYYKVETIEELKKLMESVDDSITKSFNLKHIETEIKQDSTRQE